MFSNKNRSTILEQITQSQFDIIIIGGGITGCGIALDAASRGLSVLLLEKNDFASGTSSKSTKLIHGGLRYLKGLEFKIVAEVGKERAIVYKSAPHLVYPEKMLLPIVKNGSLGKFTTSLALWLYDFLAGVHGSQRKRMLNKNETIAEEPCLKKDIIIGGGLYYEYRTNDARLTMEVLKTANLFYKATALNYCQVTSLNYNQDKIIGVTFKDTTTNLSYSCFGKQIINATGPWVDNIRKMDNSMDKKQIVHSKGVHIVLAHEKLPLKHAVYYDVPDGRMVFAIPVDAHTYIGTTDTFYKESIENPSITAEDLQYLIQTIPIVFDVPEIKISDIISAWSGVRPLIFEEGKKAGELSRHDEIFVSKSGLITIAGGKLTGYRLMSEKVVSLCLKNLSITDRASNTENIQLLGARFTEDGTITQIIENFLKRYAHTSLSEKELKDLFLKYGNETIQLIDTYYASLQNILLAELAYCLDHEMVFTLNDFMHRRTSYALYNPNLWEDTPIETLANYIGVYFNLSPLEKQTQIDEFKSHLLKNRLPQLFS